MLTCNIIQRLIQTAYWNEHANFEHVPKPSMCHKNQVVQVIQDNTPCFCQQFR